MIKSLIAANKSERDKFTIPRSVQQSIPVKCIYEDGTWQIGRKHSRTWRFTDVNYAAASEDDQRGIFLSYGGVLNSLPTDAAAKVTIINRRLNPVDFERTMLMKERGDGLDKYRREANAILTQRAAESNNLVQEKYITLSIPQRKIEESRAYFRRVDANLSKSFGRLDGCQVIAPQNVTLTGGQTTYLTVPNDTVRAFTIKKVDAQNKSSLQGAVFRFEQIDGDYETTGITGFDGKITFEGEALPYGSYRVTEQSAPSGYVKDTRVETIEWTGEHDVMLTFENVREIRIIIVKKDARTGVSLAGASFDIFADGKYLTSVTTNDAGEAYVTGIKAEMYIEARETKEPEHYLLDRTSHGIHVDPYNPAIADDPVLTITNEALASLRIIKYDRVSGTRLSGVTFEIYKDAQLFDTKRTDENGGAATRCCK